MSELWAKHHRLILSSGLILMIDQTIFALAWWELIPLPLVMDRWMPFSVLLTSVLAIVIILWLWHYLNPDLKPGWLVVGLGTLSNLITVFIYGTVLDYLPIYQFTINLADLLIIGGLTWIGWKLFQDVFDQRIKSS